MKINLLHKCLIGALLIIAIGIGCSFLTKEKIIKNPSEWPSDIIRKANAIFGTIRVVDLKGNKTLFYYYDDQDINPQKFSKNENGEWIVVFKTRNDKRQP